LKIAAASRGGALLVFSKDDCPTCRFTLPFLQRVHEALAPRGVRIAAISQDDASRGARFASDLGISFPILIDAPAFNASRRYGVMTVPTCFLIDRDGVILRTLVGFSRKEIEAAAKDLAERSGASVPTVFQAGEQIPETRPG
jgi:peroxiredoxin